jgi:hypothetical protein
MNWSISRITDFFGTSFVTISLVVVSACIAVIFQILSNDFVAFVWRGLSGFFIESVLLSVIDGFSTIRFNSSYPVCGIKLRMSRYGVKLLRAGRRGLNLADIGEIKVMLLDWKGSDDRSFLGVSFMF